MTPYRWPAGQVDLLAISSEEDEDVPSRDEEWYQDEQERIRELRWEQQRQYERRDR